MRIRRNRNDDDQERRGKDDEQTDPQPGVVNICTGNAQNVYQAGNISGDVVIR